MTSLSVKQQRIKLVEKLSIVVELLSLDALTLTLDIQEGAWAKKVGLALLKKFD
jgi:hypothetical protein